MNFLKIFWKNYKTLFAIIIAAGLTAAIFFYIIVPLKTQINEKADKIQEIIIEQEVDISRIAQLPEFNRQFDLINVNHDKFDLFISDSTVVDLLRQIEFLADVTGNDIEINIVDKEKTLLKQTQLKVLSEARQKLEERRDETQELPPTVIENLPHDKYLEMEIMAWGDFNQLLEFVYKLNGLSFLSDITQLNIIKQENEALNLGQGSAIFPVSATDGDESAVDEESDIDEIRASKELASQINMVFYLE